MSGEKESVALDSLKKVERQLERYQDKTGIIRLAAKSDAGKYINADHNEMRKLSADECGEAAVILMQYATFVQKAYNIEIARVNWIDSEIKVKIASEMKQYASGTFEERKMLAIAESEYTRKLYELRQLAQGLADELSFIATRVDGIARAYMSLLQIKRKQNGN